MKDVFDKVEVDAVSIQEWLRDGGDIAVSAFTVIEAVTLGISTLLRHPLPRLYLSLRKARSRRPEQYVCSHRLYEYNRCKGDADQIFEDEEIAKYLEKFSDGL